MSFSSSVDVLNDRSRFTNFWRTHPSEGNLANVVLAILKEYGWNNTKIITQNDGLFIDVSAEYRNRRFSQHSSVHSVVGERRYLTLLWRFYNCNW